MPNPRSIKRKPAAKHYPRYDADQAAKLKRFLAAFLIDARRMVARTREMAIADKYSEMTTNQLDYWVTATAVAKDLIARVNYRQRHLLDITDEQIAEVLASCRQRSQT